MAAVRGRGEGRPAARHALGAVPVRRPRRQGGSFSPSVRERLAPASVERRLCVRVHRGLCAWRRARVECERHRSHSALVWPAAASSSVDAPTRQCSLNGWRRRRRASTCLERAGSPDAGGQRKHGATSFGARCRAAGARANRDVRRGVGAAPRPRAMSERVLAPIIVLALHGALLLDVACHAPRLRDWSAAGVGLEWCAAAAAVLAYLCVVTRDPGLLRGVAGGRPLPMWTSGWAWGPSLPARPSFGARRCPLSGGPREARRPPTVRSPRTGP